MALTAHHEHRKRTKPFQTLGGSTGMLSGDSPESRGMSGPRSNERKLGRLRMSHDWITETVATLPAICTADEAAKLLRTTTRSIRRWTASGRLKCLHTSVGGSSRLL